MLVTLLFGTSLLSSFLIDDLTSLKDAGIGDAVIEYVEFREVSFGASLGAFKLENPYGYTDANEYMGIGNEISLHLDYELKYSNILRLLAYFGETPFDYDYHLGRFARPGISLSLLHYFGKYNVRPYFGLGFELAEYYYRRGYDYGSALLSTSIISYYGIIIFSDCPINIELGGEIPLAPIILADRFLFIRAGISIKYGIS